MDLFGAVQEHVSRAFHACDRPDEGLAFDAQDGLCKPTIIIIIKCWLLLILSLCEPTRSMKWGMGVKLIDPAFEPYISPNG